MKQIILLCMMFWLMNHTLWAQTEAGNKLVGGQLLLRGTFSENKDRASVFQYELAPYVGYFIKENFTIGGGVSFSNLKIEDESINYEYIDKNLSIFAASRYYIPIGEAKKFYVYAQGALEFLWDKNEFVHDSRKTVIREYILAISPGFAYFPSLHWGLELSFSGLNAKVIDIKDRQSYTSVTLGTDSFAPSLGVSYYF